MLTNLALILGIAAVVTVLFRRLRQPVVLAYLVAGMIVGPHLPVPVFADAGVARQTSELGVVLLMFSLGLDLSLRRLLRVIPTAGLVAAIECSLMIALGYLAGRGFGWSRLESLFLGGIVAISSTTIIIKAFAEQRVEGPQTDVVFGILVVEDLIAILLVAVLTPAASGVALSSVALARTVGKLVAFLIALLAVGLLVVPRAIRAVVRMGSPETTIVACAGLAFGFAVLAHAFGYSVALGAFLAGALVAESGEGPVIAPLVAPLRDMFAAVFFVSVGMLIDPRVVAHEWLTILLLTALVIVGKVVGVTLGAFLAGRGVRTSVQAGMSLAQVGEFSFIIAGVGLGLGAVRGSLYPVAVTVSALTTLTTPLLIRASGRVAALLDQRLPAPLQTFATLYGSWVERLGTVPQHRTAWGRIRRLMLLLAVDTVAVAGIGVGASLAMPSLIARVGPRLGHSVARALVIAAGGVLVAPFVLGALRLARALGLRLAAEVFPTPDGALDLAAAPRRALVVTLQVAILLVAGIPLVAVAQPFFSSVPLLVVLVAGLAVLVLPLWRSATNLHSHAKAGAQVLLEALASQSRPAAEATVEARALIPGRGEATAMRLPPDASPVGKTLEQVGLRALTGATVIAIDRGPDDVLYPTADEVLRPGDLLVVTGSRDAVAAARRLLGADEISR